VATPHRTHRIRRPLDRGLRQFGAVGIAGGLAGDGTQAEALAGVKAGALQPAIVVDQAFRLPILQEQLAVIGAVQGVVDDALGPGAVEPRAGEKQILGDQRAGHDTVPIAERG